MTLDAGEVKTITTVFRESAAQYHKTFPEKLATLFITRGIGHVYVAPEIADLVAANIADINAMVKERAARMRIKNWGAQATEFTITHDGGKARIAQMMLPEKNISGFVSEDYPAEINAIGAFDHEMGHFVVKGGYGDDIHLAECAADAFAALRHIQRFGTKTGMAAQAACNRAENIILYDSPAHYTSAVFQKVAALLKEDGQALQSLSLPETAALAATIAKDHALDKNRLDKIHAAYAPVRDVVAVAPPDPVKIVKKIVAVMLGNKNDADIYRAGQFFLDSPKIKTFIAAAGLTDDPSFQAALADIRHHGRAAGLTPALSF